MAWGGFGGVYFVVLPLLLVDSNFDGILVESLYAVLGVF